MYEYDVNDYEQRLFRDLANYYYMTTQKEADKKPKPITDTLYYYLINTPCTNGYTLDEYKGAKALNSTYQIHRLANMMIQQGKKPNVNDMEKEFERQERERLNVRNVVGKGLVISGVIDMIMIGVNNMAKVEGIITATGEDAQARFIAVMDDRTTKMCKSLNGQIFNVRGENVFKRWSETDQSMRIYKCRGLVLGLNLPPIANRISLVQEFHSIC